MSLIALIPKIFYSDLRDGLHLFVDGLQFSIVYDDRHGPEAFCILRRDALKVHIVQNDALARLDRPELRLETDTINALHADVAARCPDLLHPNGKHVTLKPWGLYEFALLDASHVCIIVEQRADVPR